MNIEGTKFENVIVFKPEIFTDFRGKYVETFNRFDFNCILQNNGISIIEFVQDDVSYSKFGVLRGLHGDQETWKLVSCLRGKFALVIVDCKKKSATYKQWQKFILSAEDNHQVLIPPGFANGHLCLSSECIFHYKQSTYYQGQKSQFIVAWNDPDIAIDWEIEERYSIPAIDEGYLSLSKIPVLSKRDSEGPFLKF
jgi:dTDP-4-dehydrorhamnose 3,5-epimerase